MRKNSIWYYFPYALLFLYVLFICVALWQLNERMNYAVRYPARIMQGAGEMRTRLKEMQHFVPWLLTSANPDSGQILEWLNKQKDAQTKSYDLIKDNLQGESGILDSIQAGRLEIRESLYTLANFLKENDDPGRALSLFTTTIIPRMDKFYALLSRTYEYAQQTMDERKIQTEKEVRLCILLSLVVGMLIFMSFYAVNKKEQKQTLKLKERDRLFEELTQNVDEVFLISSGQGGFSFVSDNSQRVLNISSETLINNPEDLFWLMPEQDAQWLREQLATGSAAARRIVHLENSIRVFRLGFNRIPAETEARGGAIISLRDQTHEWQQQQALNSALENAKAASQAKSSFLSHMSHEIRTPMNAIIGMTTIALNKISDTERVHDCLVKITDSSRHLLNLINDVLDMSKIENGKLSISQEQFSLPRAIQNINDLVRPQARARQINFDITQENVDTDELIGDNLRLNQILLNILSNSVKFTPEGGQITLRLQQLEKDSRNVHLRFVISDTGIGMSQEFLTRIFKPFEQATQGTAAKYGGTGLGMSITANLVALMGGTIKVESEEGRGSTFTVELPFGYSQEIAEKQYELPPLHVLVADDDQGTCEHASLLLEKMGLSVQWVTSGLEAIEAVKEAHDAKRKFDVCFIDWKMPGMDGEETARRIRNAAGDDLLIIIISAYDWGPIEESAKAAGVDEFVAKPFFASTLFDTLVTTARKFGLRAGDANAPGCAHDFAGKRILLVEDNEFNREIANEFLDMAHAEVENAENGQEAVNIFDNSPAGHYDLILMDVQMPVMNGYEATRAIRASSHPDAKTIPILAMTANAFSEDVAAATAAGMNGHIAKPIDIENMYGQIARHLCRPAS